jgi:hypothetical protein
MKYFLFLTLLVFGCHSRQPADIKIKNKLLYQTLLGYIQEISKAPDSVKVITVSFKARQDTIFVAIANSFPDLKLAHFNGLTLLKGYQICFVGSYFKNSLYERNANNIDIPKSIQEANSNYWHITNASIISEPIVWYLKFVNGTLVYYSPKQDFIENVPALR